MSDRTRRLILVLLALGAALSALGAAAVVAQRQARLRGALNGIPDIDLPPRVPILGVNADLTQYDPAALGENLDLIAGAGFVWVRQVFAWEEIEAQRGQYDWSRYDRVVEAVSARDLRPVAVLWRSPGWAAPEPGAPPDDLGHFAAFAAALAGRYGDRIDVYQIWDEPNLSGGWGGQPPSPVAYAAMLEAAYDAIHSADPDALVLTAGLAPNIETGPQNLSDVLFLRALYENGAAPFFDGVAGKPYGFDTGPGDRRANPDLLNFSRFILLRREMERFGDHDKSLWASSFGWNALPEGWEGQPSVWGQTTPETQAAQTVAAYRRALVEWPWSGALILETWQPDTSPDDPRRGFALRGADGELSPTVEAIREQAEVFNTVLWPGIYPPTTPLAAYGGEWEFSGLGADFSQQGGSVVDVPFAGDSLAVIARRDHYRAYLYVEVDGRPPAALPHDERGAYLVLTSPDYKPRVEALTIAEGLEPGTRHVAHIEAERGWGQWALVGFAVGSHVDTTLYDLLAAGLVIGALVLAGAAIRIGRGLSSPDPLRRLTGWLSESLSGGVHLALSLVLALAAWLGAALAWGGEAPDLTRVLGEGATPLSTALTAGVSYFSGGLVLMLVALMALLVLIYARPAAGVALVMFFTPYYLHPRPLFDRAFSMVEVMSLLTLLAWVGRIVAEWRGKGWPRPGQVWRKMTGLDRGVALFVVLSAISLGWADLVGVAATELRQMVLEPGIVYLVLRTVPFSDEERWRIVDLLLLTGAVVALIGLYQFATGSGVITAEAGIARVRSVYGSPNSVALCLGRLIPVSAAVVLIGGTRARRWLYGAAGVLMIAAVTLTLSKGGLLLGLPAGLALVVILGAGRWGTVAAIAGIALEGLALIPLSRIPRFQGLFDFTSGTSTSFFRLKLWQSTLRMIRDQPVTGVGLGQFLYEYRGRYILPGAWQEPDLGTPHNFLLSYWARLGIVGLAAGVWMQVAFWRLAWGTQKRLKEIDPAARALVVGLMGGMAASVAHGMVDALYYLIDLAFLFFLMLGLVHQIGEEVRPDGSDNQGADAAAG
jgi:O-antigen ligase